ncbi:choice-of-anchor D domain-containing protein [Flavobacterium luminosum]|uniref:Choice-of-anchor D domain-containing protein n=1 Tax=Flavobacterium luminosum TaxID=2949086 RepID=A0ABT0TQ10_9FLAO|nr:choice-of-anchor D domain-containing protein [Flavobacterium sp. HXWNR70]MCL9809586.1 choice-of-anchor D domain-containing protein [Flavobacterium sp. HXWNR70]
MKLKLLVLAFLCSIVSWGQTIIVSDGLNDATTLFTLSNGAYYNGNSAATDGPSSSPFAFEGTHSRGVSNATATLLSSDINSTGYTSISMSFKLASFSIGGAGNGADVGDIVTVEVSPNGGTNWYSTLRILGNSNAYWAYSATGNANTAYDGNATPVDFQPGGGGVRTTDGYSSINISGLPSTSNLKFRITLLNNSANERWVLDDFKVEGTLTTCSTPTITTNPSTSVQNYCAGASATALSVAATGAPTLTYQWYSNTVASASGGTLIAGATSATYTPSTASVGTLYYYCEVGSTCMPTPTPAVSNVSGAVNVTAIPSAPSGTINITANPSCGAATLTYSAPSANIYWQTSATGTVTTNPTTSSYISSATAGSYTIYVRELSGTCWSPATSVTFTVAAPVAITGQATNQATTVGNTATFSVTASNAAGYQWQVNTGSGWANIAGATSASYTTPAATLAMSGYQYQVIVTGNAPCGTVTSSAATLSVTTGPCLSESFTVNTLPSGWVQTSVTFASNRAEFQSQTGELTTIAVNYPTNLTFTLERTGSSVAKTMLIEVSTTTQGGTYTTVATYDHSNTTSNGTVNCTVDLSAYTSYPNVFIKFRKDSATSVARWGLDDIQVFCGTPPSGPEINITGSGVDIVDGDTTPSVADDTNFGSTTLSTNIVRSFVIHNQGTTNLVLSGPVTLTDVSAPQEFTVTQPALTTIPAGGNTTFTVTFNSAIAGTFTNTVNIPSNDSNEALYNFDIVATAYDATATGTVFRPGDLIFVGYDSTVSAAADCSGGAQMDKLYVANLIDILPGTEFMVVNSRYESGAAANTRTDRWYSGSTDPYDDPGIITFKWNGTAPIVAGSIITFKANVFTVNDIRINDVVTTDFNVTTNANQCNISSTESDQIYIMQGNFTPFGVIGTNRYNLFNGRVLFGLTNGASWVPFTSAVSSANTSAGRVSRLPEDLECFNIEASSLEGVRYYQNSGLHTGSKNQILGAIMNLGNWSSPTNDNCLSTTENFNPSANDNAVGKPFTVTTSNPDGTWTGFTDTDWFKCSNWEGLAVPKSTTDVVIPSVANQPVIGASTAKFPTGAFSNNLTIDGGSSLTMNNAASRLNLYGNWTNNAGNTAFEEGNGTIHFTGSAPQIINNNVNGSTEEFYNVILNNNFDTSVSNDIIANGNLTVNATRTLNIASNDYVDVQYSVTNNGAITIQDDGSLVQRNDLGNYSGSGTHSMTRIAENTKSLDYVYWSSPIISAPFSSIPYSRLYEWDTDVVNPTGYGQGNWVGTADAAMQIGKGYIFRVPNGDSTQTVTFSGSLFNNALINKPIIKGTITVPFPGVNAPITEFDDNWNLVGNPYPSAIDAETFAIQNSSVLEDGTIYLWRHLTGPTSTVSPYYQTFTYNYVSTDYVSYNGTASIPAGAFDGKIAAGQGYFVKMKEAIGSSANLQFSNTQRSRVFNNSQFFRTMSKGKSSREKHRIWLDLLDANKSVTTQVVAYVEGATNDDDFYFDSKADYRSDLGFHSINNNTIFDIQARTLPFDVNDKVPLGVQLPTDGTYTIAIGTLDGLFATTKQKIYVEDKLNQTIHDLTFAPYQFTANKGVINDRFILRYTDQALGNTDFETIAEGVKIYGSDHAIVIDSKTEAIQSYDIYNVLGQLLAYKKQVKGYQAEEATIMKNNQALIVKVTLENGQVVSKKIMY